MYIIRCFKSLADETRLRLYYLLLHYEFSVNEIVQVMEMGQSRISRHLKVLSDSGLLLSRRDGSFVYYQGARSRDLHHLTEFILQWARVQEVFQADLERAQRVSNERKERTRLFFNSVADYWDLLKREILGEFDLSPIIRSWSTSCEVAVDLGCGTGDDLPLLAEQAQKVIGVDSSLKMLDRTRSRLKGSQSNVELRLGELEHLPLSDQEANLAVANMVLRHVSEPMLGLREIKRILRPGGVFVLSDFDLHQKEEVRKKYGGVWLGFAKEQLQEWLQEAGFAILQLEEYQVRQGLKVNVLVSRRS
ncbi:MAG: metalloregulator ArsR/SmtB family transcription factor [Desulfohalobiaceae bacterium]